MLYRFLKSVVVGPPSRLLWRPWVRGMENVPDSGPAILASNHLAVVDSLFLPILVSRPVTFPAKKEYFTGKGFKGRMKRWFFSGVGQVPMDRGGGRAARTGLEALEKKLRDGELVGFYPEGTRSP
ncbi:MAG TPA: lysophospholipid acyltransferase family protein, partial [Mycobacteriales bacterium]|nr:lysophospholipid acyltransferase family protein [Mycobacteriales bacterium]